MPSLHTSTTDTGTNNSANKSKQTSTSNTPQKKDEWIKKLAIKLEDNRYKEDDKEACKKLRELNSEDSGNEGNVLKQILNVLFLSTGLCLLLAVIITIAYTTIEESSDVKKRQETVRKMAAMLDEGGQPEIEEHRDENIKQHMSNYSSQNINNVDQTVHNGDAYKGGNSGGDGRGEYTRNYSGNGKDKYTRNENGDHDKNEMRTNAFVGFNRYDNYDLNKVRQEQRNYDRIFKNNMIGGRNRGYERRKEGWGDGEDGGSGIRAEQMKIQKYKAAYRGRYDWTPKRKVNLNARNIRTGDYKKEIYSLYQNEDDDDEDGGNDDDFEKKIKPELSLIMK